MRDIDDWMFHFERQVSPRLKELFGQNFGELAALIASRLEKLKEMDASLLDCPASEKPARAPVVI
ncbi:MAG TPA: hypothetical protein VIF39_08035 [Hyphomicrobium sp.]